jgi:hypothetical protein
LAGILLFGPQWTGNTAFELLARVRLTITGVLHFVYRPDLQQL